MSDQPSMVNLKRLEQDVSGDTPVAPVDPSIAPVDPAISRFAPQKYRTDPTIASMIEDLRKIRAAVDDVMRKLEDHRAEQTRRLG